jgi:hypothetical protein
MEKPFQNPIKDLGEAECINRPAKGFIGIWSPMYKDNKRCGTCEAFYSEPLANPGGWCNDCPSKQVNTHEEGLCPLWRLSEYYKGKELYMKTGSWN